MVNERLIAALSDAKQLDVVACGLAWFGAYTTGLRYTGYNRVNSPSLETLS